MSVSWLGPIRQISFTTDDIDRQVRFWETQIGVGPFEVFRDLTLTMTFEGRPIALPVRVALALHGGVLIELMQVKGEGPSPFHDRDNRPIIGLQRLASVTDAIQEDAAVARSRGLEQFVDGIDATGQRYFYFRSPAAPGIILELLENTEGFRAFVAGLEARSRSG